MRRVRDDSLKEIRCCVHRATVSKVRDAMHMVAAFVNGTLPYFTFVKHLSVRKPT